MQLALKQKEIVESLRARVAAERAWHAKEAKAEAEYADLETQMATLRAYLVEEERLITSGLVQVRSRLCTNRTRNLYCSELLDPVAPAPPSRHTHVTHCAPPATHRVLRSTSNY